MPSPVEGAILKKYPVFGVIILPSTAANSGRRVAPQNKKPSPFKRLGFVLYSILVVLSALIVGAYAVWNFTVKDPEIPVQPTPPLSAPEIEPSPSASESEEPDELVRDRREGVYTFALLGSDKASTNTDTIILVTFDTKEHTVGMVCIAVKITVDHSGSSPVDVKWIGISLCMNHRKQILLRKNRNSQRLCLGQLGAGFRTCDYIRGLFGHRRCNLSAVGFDHL